MGMSIKPLTQFLALVCLLVGLTILAESACGADGDRPSLDAADIRLKDDGKASPYDRMNRVQRLSSRKSNTADVVAALVHILTHDASPEIRTAAVDALAKQGARIKETEAVARTAVAGGKDPKVRAEIARKLLELGNRSDEIRAAIQTALTADKEPHVRAAAARAVPKAGGKSDQLCKTLAPVLANDKELAVRAAAADGLRSPDAAAADALPPLIKGLADPDPDGRLHVLWSIGSFGPAAKPAVPELAKQLHDKSDCNVYVSDHYARPRPLRYEVALALGHIGPAADSQKEAIAAMMRGDADDEVRAAAAVASYQITGRHEQAMSVLRRLLRESSEDGKFTAMLHLEDMGANAAEALPELRVLFEDESGLLRAVAIISLDDIGAAARPAIPALEKIAKSDPDEDVRERAKEALKKIKAH